MIGRATPFQWTARGAVGALTQLVWKADAAKGAFWVGLLLYPLLQAPLTEVMTCMA